MRLAFALGLKAVAQGPLRQDGKDESNGEQDNMQEQQAVAGEDHGEEASHEIQEIRETRYTPWDSTTGLQYTYSNQLFGGEGRGHLLEGEGFNLERERTEIGSDMHTDLGLARKTTLRGHGCSNTSLWRRKHGV